MGVLFEARTFNSSDQFKLRQAAQIYTDFPDTISCRLMFVCVPVCIDYPQVTLSADGQCCVGPQIQPQQTGQRSDPQEDLGQAHIYLHHLSQQSYNILNLLLLMDRTSCFTGRALS
jgi:hypothetical protein